MAAERHGSVVLSQWVAAGALGAGLVGGVVGLVIGLLAHPPTAWFAIFEIGVPAGALGALVGFMLGVLAKVVSRFRGRLPTDE